jgi:hypothetical protein
MYLVSLYYRGAMNVNGMRLFKTQRDVLIRLNELDKETKIGADYPSEIEAGAFRVYKMSKNLPPVNMTKEFLKLFVSYKNDLPPVKQKKTKYVNSLLKSAEDDPSFTLDQIEVSDVVFPSCDYWGNTWPYICMRINHPLEKMCGIPRFRIVASSNDKELGKVIWFYKHQQLIKYDSEKHCTKGMKFLEGKWS